MSAKNDPIYFARVGYYKDGAGKYKLSDGNGKVFGRAFRLKPKKKASAR